MPNVTGYIAFVRGDIVSCSESTAFYGDPNNMDRDHGGTGLAWGFRGIVYDFSRASSIFGNSSTVTPKSLTAALLIRY